jgi:hypothetical protein
MLGKANGSAVAVVIGATLFVLLNALAIGTWASASGQGKMPGLEAPSTSIK